MQNNPLDLKYIFLGLILIFSGILVFFGFFFGIVFFNDFISGNPFTFIFSFFTMFFLISLIFIAGVFMIQKSAKHKNFRFGISDEYEQPNYTKKKGHIVSSYIKKNQNSKKTNFCLKCGSEVFEADVFCLNCGNKI